MKALVVGSDFTECSRVTKILRDAGHEVKIFNDEKAALATLTPESAQVILVYTLAPSEGVLEFVKQARIKAALTTPILFGSDLPEAFAVRVAEAGATAEIRKFGGKELVLARVAALQAYAALVHRAALGETSVPASKTAGPATPTAGTPNAETQSGPLEQLARTNAWRTATSAVVGRTSQFLSLDTRVDGVAPSAVPLELGTSLVLSNVEKQVELRVAMACSKAGAEALAVQMMGEDGKGLGQDCLQEVCNLTMGVLKDAFAEEAVLFTSGVPSVMSPETCADPAQLLPVLGDGGAQGHGRSGVDAPGPAVTRQPAGGSGGRHRGHGAGQGPVQHQGAAAHQGRNAPVQHHD